MGDDFEGNDPQVGPAQLRGADSGGGNGRPAAARQPAITAAALLFIIVGAGWLPGLVYALVYVAINGDLPIIFGFPAGAGRIYDAFGRDGAIVALGLYATVQALGILAGLWLWKSRRRGAVLGTITIVAGPLFWYGFGLPPGPWIAALQVVLMAVGWRSLR